MKTFFHLHNIIIFLFKKFRSEDTPTVTKYRKKLNIYVRLLHCTPNESLKWIH